MKGLLVDYGGVLTASIGRSFRDFERAEGLPKGTVLRLLQSAYTADEEESPIARFERGEMELAPFEQALADELVAAGYAVASDGIVERLFGGMVPDEQVWSLLEQAREAGVRTGLLSNSWGVEGYPRDRFERYFDAVVISGEEGVRKPSPGIFLLAARRLGVEPHDCAFVDDLDRNVEVARQLGMCGILHRDAAGTAEELSGFLGVELQVP